MSNLPGQMMKRFLYLVVVAIALSGCQTTPTSKNTVDAYLEALQKGKTQQQQELSCSRKDAVKSNEPLANLEKWEVTKQEAVTSKADSDSKYELVSAKIETKTIGGFSVARTWKFDVWESDDFFESRKRTIDKLNQMRVRTDELVNQANAMTGEKPMKPRELEVPARSDYSSNQYCVLRYEGES